MAQMLKLTLAPSRFRVTLSPTLELGIEAERSHMEYILLHLLAAHDSYCIVSKRARNVANASEVTST